MNTYTPIKKLLIASISALALTVAIAGDAAAQNIVIQDDFTAPDGTPNWNRNPAPVNALNVQWINGWQGFDVDTLIIDNSLRIGFNAWAYFNVANSPTLSKPETITVGANLRTGNMAAAVYSGVALGFYSIAPTVGSVGFSGSYSAEQNFRGLLLKGNGDIVFSRDSNETLLHRIDSFDAATFYNLEFSIDTSRGIITSIYLDGTIIVPGMELGGFSDSETNYVGVWGRGTALDQRGYIGDFTLTGDFVVIPESSTITSVVAFLAVAAILFRRRKQ